MPTMYNDWVNKVIANLVVGKLYQLGSGSGSSLKFEKLWFAQAKTNDIYLDWMGDDYFTIDLKNSNEKHFAMYLGLSQSSADYINDQYIKVLYKGMVVWTYTECVML